MQDMMRIFLGFDARETVAFHVASHSIHAGSSIPVSIAPLMLSQLKSVFDRPRDPKQSTDFAFTRFLVPYLCGFQGWAVFADGDILVRRDVAELWALRDDRYAVRVVKHDHQPKETRKFLGQVQTAYEKKNWSSLMLFNCAKCEKLTPDYVARTAGLDLHQFRWLSDEALIGELPHEWNVLVGFDPAPLADHAAVLHYTIGGPWFSDYRTSPKADVWWRALNDMLSPVGAGDLAAR
jgi:lipopolysaccharide biosynthesis glycosyltransferase